MMQRGLRSCRPPPATRRLGASRASVPCRHHFRSSAPSQHRLRLLHTPPRVATTPSEQAVDEDGSEELYPVPSSVSTQPLQDSGESSAADRHLLERTWYSETDSAPAYEVASVDAEGNIVYIELQRREILAMTGLQARELRLIDPTTYASLEKAVLTAVKGVALVSLAGLRVIVQSSRAIIFRPKSKLSSFFIEGLAARLSYENSEEIAASGHVKLPFELEVIEAALLEATWQLEKKLSELSPRVQRLYATQQKGGSRAITNEMLEELRAVKQSLVDLTDGSTTVENLLLELLDDDASLESISQWQKTSRDTGEEPSTAAAVDEAADMLLYYCSKAEVVRTEATRLLENSKGLEVSIGVTLNARRYEVNKLELLLAVASFAVGVGGLFSGLFGMNFLNGGEQSRRAFYSALCLILAGVVAIFSRLARA